MVGKGNAVYFGLLSLDALKYAAIPLPGNILPVLFRVMRLHWPVWLGLSSLVVLDRRVWTLRDLMPIKSRIFPGKGIYFTGQLLLVGTDQEGEVPWKLRSSQFWMEFANLHWLVPHSSLIGSSTRLRESTKRRETRTVSVVGVGALLHLSKAPPSKSRTQHGCRPEALSTGYDKEDCQSALEKERQ
jgi:hypothetical protein